MGLVETKLAIIPGGGMSCSRLPHLSASLVCSQMQGAVGRPHLGKEADAVQLCVQQRSSLFPLSISVGPMWTVVWGLACTRLPSLSW